MIDSIARRVSASQSSMTQGHYGSQRAQPAPAARGRSLRVGSWGRLAAAIVCAMFVGVASGQDGVADITEAEWKLIPSYCPNTQGMPRAGRNSPETLRWVGMMGETFYAMHHYCWGIIKLMRSEYRGSPQVVQYGYRRAALGEFKFVEREMPSDFVLAPEVYTYIGRTHLLLGESKQAAQAFGKARALRPDYWPAYSWWATFLLNNGYLDDARALIEEGLKYSPNERALLAIRDDIESTSRKNKKATNPRKKDVPALQRP